MSGRPWRGALAEASDLAYEDERGEDQRAAYEAWVDAERGRVLSENLDTCGGVFHPGGDNPAILQCDKCGAVAYEIRRGTYARMRLRIEDGFICEVNGPCRGPAVWHIALPDGNRRLCETHAKNPDKLPPP